MLTFDNFNVTFRIDVKQFNAVNMYQCLGKNSLKDKEGYQLVSVRQGDMELIRVWRNAQTRILRQQNEISSEQQQHYFKDIIQPTFNQKRPQQILFSFLLNDQCIGYGGLTHLNWDSSRAEVSFLVDSQRIKDAHQYARDHKHFLALLCQVAFGDLHLHRLFTETFSFRQNHIANLEAFGFIHEGILREHMYKDNQWYDSVMHGLLAGEWNHAK